MSVVVTEPITSGLVVLKTSLGDVLIELWKREAPKAVRNFVQLCLEGHYDGVPFNRIVPGFIAQIGGDDDCIYDEGSFEVETNQRLKFNRRGLVAMASDPATKSNMSQFFFTLDNTPELQNKHTIFGRITGDTLFNVLKLQEVELEPNSDRPVYAPIIKSVEVMDNPFEDGPEKIVPRITAQERKEQERAKREMKIERAKQREQGKRKGTKNKALLSFGEDAEEPLDASAPKTKFKSAHDVVNDGRLSAKVIDDRGTSATLPADFMNEEMRAPPPKKRRAEDDNSKGVEEKRSRAEPSSSSKLEEARALKSKAPKSDAERRKEEIAKVQAELKKLSKSADSDEDEAKKSKKPKRSGPSLLQLEREKYLKAGSATAPSSKVSKGKRKVDDDADVLSALDGFRKKLGQASSKSAPEPKEEDQADRREKLHGIDLNDDELEDDDDIDLWAAASAHSLKFRKDATLDQHNIDEYSVVDPLAKESRTLDEMKVRAANSSTRRYAGDRERDDSNRGGGGSSRAGGSGGDRDRRRDDRSSGGGGRDRYEDRRRDNRRDGGGSSRGDRPEVQGNWKKDRISTADLA
ncbi:uncharacterized protein JCM6883_002598 [Sporobolomyces salmoneus]|uniref:uncharacterized protein n=1 Tax=Sporobolomyces salmoneus TaxID=183962 RepID=UPI003174AEB6